MAARTVLVADIGKSQTRLALFRDGAIGDAVIGDGIAGLATTGGTRDALDRFDLLLPELHRAESGADLVPDSIAPDAPAPDAVAVGVAGAIGAPAAALELAQELSRRCAAPASVSSDVVTAHLGALGGEPGTMLVAGTGAVAFGVSSTGEVKIVDGLGPELGDHGSGYWIGRAGLRAALRVERETALEAAAAERFGQLSPPAWLAAQPQPLAAVASFAPTVLDAAQAGDPVALEIAEGATRYLARTAREASSEEAAVCVLGGLTSHPWFFSMLTAALESEGLRPQHSLGTAMLGAALAASRTDFPHERLIHRAV